MKAVATASERIVNALTERIAAGDLTPGTRLAEVAIAEQFGTSRTPAREALRALVQAGLVEKTPDRQYSVKLVDLRVIRELYRIRCALEDLLVTELLSNCSSGEFDRLLKRLEEAPGDAGGIICSFHETLADLCGNSELRDMLRHLYTRLEPYRILDGACRADTVDDDHRKILEALQRGDEVAVRELMRQHIGRSLEAINHLLDRGITSARFAQV